MRRPGLWVAIGLNLALLTLAVSLLDAAVFFLVTQRVLVDATDSLATRSAEVVAAQLGAVGADGWKKVVEAHRRGELKDMTLFSPSGQVLAGAAGEAGPSVRAAVFTRETSAGEEDGVVEVVTPVGAPGPPAAVLRVRVPVAAATMPAWTVLGIHALFSAGLIVIFGLVLFRNSVVRPVAALREGTRRIAEGELGLQLSDEAPRELAELAASLNRMSLALAEYRGRTAEQLEHLERANAELVRTQEALVRSEKLASVGRLAAGLAHELGNPLAAVRGYVELLAMDAGPDREILERCQVETERMHLLLRGLLDFARQEEPQIVTVRLDELLGEAARTVRPRGAFRAVDVVVDAPEGVAVRGDPARLHQVLVNLLLNAADAGAGRIVLSAAVEDAGVVVACEDDGEGIPAENLPRLFEPFFTTRAPGRGTGLGLAVSHRIIEQHRGRIEVRSVPRKGTRVEFWLPAHSPVSGNDP